jgi:hypothetical protein
MDLFLPENKEFFLNQVAIFDSQLTKDKVKQIARENSPDTDTVIGARIRPLSNLEKENGHIPCVYARWEGGGFADIHALRRKVNGRPTITVCDIQTYILFCSYLSHLHSLQASNSIEFMDQPVIHKIYMKILRRHLYHGLYVYYPSATTANWKFAICKSSLKRCIIQSTKSY